MKRMLSLAAITPILLSLSGCASVDWKISAKCKTGGECEVEGTISGSTKKQKSGSKTLLDLATSSSQVFDAALFSIDVGASAPSVPGVGFVTLELVDSSTGIVQAARVFSWQKSGADLVLSDPDSVNSWAMTEGGTADSIRYQLHPFTVAQAPGQNTLVVSSQYEGVTNATATTSWNSGGGCRYASCEER